MKQTSIKILLSFTFLWAWTAAAHAQESRFPAILIKGAQQTIEAEVARVLDDGTVSLKTGDGQRLEEGVVYAVLIGNRELTRVQVTTEKAKSSLAKAVPGFRGFGGVPKGAKVSLRPVKGGGADQYVPLRMNELGVEVKVVANLAVTTLTMNFHNDLDRVLEGRLNFPLGEGQTVSRYAMTVNGKLREGVVVEKAKGRQVFESIVRRGIDPGLLEWTKGNVFKARVYPIPAKGDKTIVIAYEQELKDAGKGFLYTLPLHFKAKVDRFTLRAEVFKQEIAPDLGANELENFRFEKWSESYLAETKKENYLPNQSLTFLLPKQANRQRIFVEKDGEQSYFYLTLNPKIIKKAKKLPKKVVLLWDASASARSKDLDKEFAAMGGYFEKIGNLQVELVVFRNAAEKAQPFTIKGGDWKKLSDALRGLAYDGGTQLGSIDLAKYKCDEFLLSSDGVSNFGDSEILRGKAPIYTLNSSPVAEHAYLRYLAQATGGAYLNLAKLTTDEAVSKLVSVPYSFLGAKYDGKTVRETYPRTAAPVDGSFSLAGILTGKGTEITLNFGLGSDVLQSQKIVLDSASHASDSGMAKRIWAQKKIAELELRPDKNEDEITVLGKEHSIVTRNTSLIVLDRLQDYVQHKIVPPEPEMREEYLAQIGQQQEQKDKGRKERLAVVVKRFEQRVAWWNKKFKFGTGKQSKTQAKAEEREGLRIPLIGRLLGFEGRQLESLGEDDAAPMPSSAPFSSVSDLEITVDALSEELSADEAGSLDPFGSAPQSRPVAPGRITENLIISGFNDASYSSAQNGAARTVDAAGGGGSGGREALARVRAGGVAQGKGAIKLKKWDPKTPYLAKIKKADAKDWYKVYLEQRKGNEDSSAFFLDVADFFFGKEQPGVALRILSNVAEMDLENPQLLRILGYRLMQAGQYKLAVAIFEEVLDMREEEPQSYRDLALALASDKQHQRAIDLLQQVVEGQWDGRFPEIELTALNEMNAIIATCGKELDLGDLDQRLLKNLPVDVRVILTWDADNTDMDLWVTDPNGERCFYGHRDTFIGGHISPDYTGGYGPEEFLLKQAQPGKYQIHVKFYGNRQQIIAGATTIQVEMTTGFGGPSAKTESITLRLNDQSEIINVGQFIIPGGKEFTSDPKSQRTNRRAPRKP